MELRDFLDEVADASEMDITYKVIVDTSKIVPCNMDLGEQTCALTEALGEASAFHWTQVIYLLFFPFI